MDYNAEKKNTTTEEEKKIIKDIKDINYFKKTKPIKESAYYDYKNKECLFFEDFYKEEIKKHKQLKK